MVDWQQEFFNRRQTPGAPPDGRERRQFADSRDALPPDLAEFSRAVDAYKLAHARRFVTLAELLEILKVLGYHK